MGGEVNITKIAENLIEKGKVDVTFQIPGEATWPTITFDASKFISEAENTEEKLAEAIRKEINRRENLLKPFMPFLHKKIKI